jgi:hypothetical protein
MRGRWHTGLSENGFFGKEPSASLQGGVHRRISNGESGKAGARSLDSVRGSERKRGRKSSDPRKQRSRTRQAAMDPSRSPQTVDRPIPESPVAAAMADPALGRWMGGRFCEALAKPSPGLGEWADGLRHCQRELADGSLAAYPAESVATFVSRMAQNIPEEIAPFEQICVADGRRVRRCRLKKYPEGVRNRQHPSGVRFTPENAAAGNHGIRPDCGA